MTVVDVNGQARVHAADHTDVTKEGALCLTRDTLVVAVYAPGCWITAYEEEASR